MHHRLGVAAAVVAAVAIALVSPAPGVVDRLEGQSQDVRFSIRGPQEAADVAVVAIDAESITELGRWPIRRTRHAQAIDRLRKAGVAAIAYDVQFTEPSGDDAADLALYEAVARAPGTVLSTTEVDDRDVVGRLRAADDEALVLR